MVDLRGKDTIALSGLADLHEAAGEWKELTEILEQQVAATEDVDAKIPIYKRLGRIWGEKLSRERNSLESWQKVLELDPQDVDALRAIAENYKSAGAWEELSQALRRLIQVAQLGGAGIEETELKELYSQLGELEGETLMRTQEAIDAWREVLELDAHDFRALAALEKLFTQEARWEECVEILERRAQALATPSEQVDVLMQVASLWTDKIGDGGSAAEVYERVLQIDAGNMTASHELEQLYRQRKSWVKLIDLLLARTEFVPDAPARIVAVHADGRDLRAAARRSRERLRGAAGRVPRGLLERSRRQGARAPGDDDRQVERAASATTRRSCRGSAIPRSRPICG